MYHSRLFSRIRAGEWPPALPNIDIGAFPLEWYYIFADGIYLRFHFFMRTLRRGKDAMTDAEKPFCKQQEGARKAVERRSSCLLTTTKSPKILLMYLRMFIDKSTSFPSWK
jgi:Plant transposon protein